MKPSLKGWLTKQSFWLSVWRRRYFSLKGSSLFFSKNTWRPDHGVIELDPTTTVEAVTAADLDDQRSCGLAGLGMGHARRHSLGSEPEQHLIEITSAGESYVLTAESAEMQIKWINAIRAAAAPSKTFPFLSLHISRSVCISVLTLNFQGHILCRLYFFLSTKYIPLHSP